MPGKRPQQNEYRFYQVEIIQIERVCMSCQYKIPGKPSDLQFDDELQMVTISSQLSETDSKKVHIGMPVEITFSTSLHNHWPQ